MFSLRSLLFSLLLCSRSLSTLYGISSSLFCSLLPSCAFILLPPSLLTYVLFSSGVLEHLCTFSLYQICNLDFFFVVVMSSFSSAYWVCRAEVSSWLAFFFWSFCAYGERAFIVTRCGKATKRVFSRGANIAQRLFSFILSFFFPCLCETTAKIFE